MQNMQIEPCSHGIVGVKNASLLETENKLKKIHVVIRKIQSLVPGARELEKFNVYSNCLIWLNELRGMYEEDRQSLADEEVKEDRDKKKIEANDISQ